MSAADRMAALMHQFALDIAQEELEHDCWVTQRWIKGRASGPADETYGPYSTALEALIKAEELRNEPQHPLGQALLAGYTPDIDVVPVYPGDAP